jgi:NADH:ubiquinone oxidoreductase subunit 2 (subunit N)
METNELSPNSPATNKHSIISLILGLLALLVSCGMFLPIPFTSFICLPASFLLGIFALFYGMISLRRIRRNNEAGMPYAWIGILSGGFIFLCVACMAAALISLLTYAPESFPLPTL